MALTVFITIALGYFIGCFQTSYLLIRILKKKDIRDFGFGNAGASNTVASFGWKLGAVVAAIDIIKPIVSSLILDQLVLSQTIEYRPYLMMLNGLFVILGHNYPFYMNFKGGKGTASLFGIMAVISFPYALVGAAIFVLVALVTDFIAMATLSALIYFVGLVIFKGMDLISIIIAVLIAAQSIYLHIPNFKRIFDGSETRISTKYHK